MVNGKIIYLKNDVNNEYTLIFMMLISCIVSVGKNKGIDIKSIPDSQHFENITNNNIVVMGRKTFLANNTKQNITRLNIVITKNKERYANEYIDHNNVIFCDFNESIQLINKSNFSSECVIIGGEDIYALFKGYISKIYLTDIRVPDTYKIEYTKFFFDINNFFKITEFSSINLHEDIAYRYIVYEKLHTVTQLHDYTYSELCKKVLTDGEYRTDRTGTGTVAIFGEQMKFDLSHSIPILTTKRVPWKSCIEELLWFLRGDTNAMLLNEKGVKIWNANSEKTFLNKVGLNHLDEGDCGANYSFQWRHFGATYVDCNQAYDNQGNDQIENIENLLKTNPYSRRIFMSAWNPCDLQKTVLPPCHVSAQFYVDNSKRLHCHMYQRSCDMFLGVPWNILSYSILTHILAFRSNLNVGSLIISTGDTHIYKNHFEQVNEQSKRDHLAAPILVMKDNVKFKSLKDIEINDFDMIGYLPHKAIKAQMSA
jgi:thymidylate synthase